MDFEEKTIKRTDIFHGKIIDVKLDEVELPNGKGFSSRELVFHPGGVSVLAITPDDKMILVRQFRKALEKVIYEVPAGKLEPGENADLSAAILRELEEETGYTAQKVEKVATFYVSPGFANEIHHLFLATGLEKVPNPRPADADEQIELLELSFEEVQKLRAEGEIEDAKTLIALQHWELMRLRQEKIDKNEWHFGR